MVSFFVVYCIFRRIGLEYAESSRTQNKLCLNVYLFGGSRSAKYECQGFSTITLISPNSVVPKRTHVNHF